MALTQCSMHSHTGPLSPLSSVPALRFLHAYLLALDSLDFTSPSLPAFFADAAVFYDADNSIHRSAHAIRTGMKARFGDLEFMHHQTCLTRVFGADVRSVGEREKQIVSVQAIMLCRLKGWEEERMVEIPRSFEFLIGRAENGGEPEAEQGAQTGEEAEGGQGAEEEGTEAREGEAERRGFQGLQVFEARAWWDSGALAKAITEKEKEDEKRRFRDIMSLNRGFPA